MSKYKCLWIVPILFLTITLSIISYQQIIRTQSGLSPSKIAYINEHLVIPESDMIINKGYPHNKYGETYGPDLSDYINKTPDLILAESDSGLKGYIKKKEKDAITSKTKTLTLYLQDGKTKIGELKLTSKK